MKGRGGFVRTVGDYKSVLEDCGIMESFYPKALCVHDDTIVDKNKTPALMGTWGYKYNSLVWVPEL